MKFSLVFLIAMLSVFATFSTAQRSCGRALLKKIAQICPEGCTVEDPSISTHLCSVSSDDFMVKTLCCPEY